MGDEKPPYRAASMALSWGIPTGHDFIPWLRRVKGLGYDGVTGFARWGWEPFLDQPEIFARMLADEGLALASVDVETEGELDRYKPVFELMNAAGCGKMVCLSARPPRATFDDEVAWLNAIGHAAAERAIEVCHHPRTMGVSATFEQADRMMHATDPAAVHLVIETGHSTKDFVDLPVAERTLTLIRRHPSRIGLVELKDWNETTDLNTPLGEGHAPLAEIAAALAEANYAGWLVVEQNGNEGLSLGRPFEETARLSRGVVRNLFGV